MVFISTNIYDLINHFQSVKTSMSTKLIVLGIINNSMKSMSKGTIPKSSQFNYTKIM